MLERYPYMYMWGLYSHKGWTFCCWFMTSCNKQLRKVRRNFWSAIWKCRPTSLEVSDLVPAPFRTGDPIQLGKIWYGCFHEWRYPKKTVWFIIMEYLLNMDDLGAPPFQETSICWKRIETCCMMNVEMKLMASGLTGTIKTWNRCRIRSYLCQTSWKPLKTIQNHIQSRQSADTAAAFTTGGVANLDTMTRWHDDLMKRWQQQQQQQQQKQQQQQQQQLNYSTNRASLAAMAFYKLLMVPETATRAEIAARP